MTYVKVLIGGINYGGKIHPEHSVVELPEETAQDYISRGYAVEVPAPAPEGDENEVDYKKLNKDKLAEYALSKGITLDVEKTKAEMIADWEAHLKALATPPAPEGDAE